MSVKIKHGLGLGLLCVLLTLAACEKAVGSSSDGDGEATGDGAVVDSEQALCYDDVGNQIVPPEPGERFYGQDAQYERLQSSYRDNGDGTITDLNTGLVWQQAFAGRMSWFDAEDYAAELELGGYDDWRLPSVEELTSIALFSGGMQTMTPYLDTDYFDFEYPEEPWRVIDGQYWSGDYYIGTVFQGDEAAFGFNFADGHIKAYPTENSPGGGPFEAYVRCVRGTLYGESDFVDNGDGTVTDLTSGLMWQRADDGSTYDWEEALAYAEGLELAGHDDWRLPDAKELQSLVDYSRNNPALDPIFQLSDDDAWCWSSTTHGDAYNNAVYISFGKGTDYRGTDVHGAGALRSDPKSGDPDDYPQGRGPQNDEVRIYNTVLCLRDAD
ncbi:MAG: DUF1566 domain-containing protein [Candidatus Coatesbacteria bacterium]|nr:DUF1566 domain-containing protein [Candidatus Coatesbacteria bacterium]